MSRCDRCNSAAAGESGFEGSYCQNCLDLFDEVSDEEIAVVQARARPSARQSPFYQLVDNQRDERKSYETPSEATSHALELSKKYDCRAVFIHYGLREKWLVRNLADGHPEWGPNASRNRGSGRVRDQSLIEQLLNLLRPSAD